MKNSEVRPFGFPAALWASFTDDKPGTLDFRQRSSLDLKVCLRLVIIGHPGVFDVFQQAGENSDYTHKLRNKGEADAKAYLQRTIDLAINTLENAPGTAHFPSRWQRAWLQKWFEAFSLLPTGLHDLKQAGRSCKEVNTSDMHEVYLFLLYVGYIADKQEVDTSIRLIEERTALHRQVIIDSLAALHQEGWIRVRKAEPNEPKKQWILLMPRSVKEFPGVLAGRIIETDLELFGNYMFRYNGTLYQGFRQVLELITRQMSVVMSHDAFRRGGLARTGYRIMRFLSLTGGAREDDIAQYLGIGERSVRTHLERLTNLGLVSRLNQIDLLDPEPVRRATSTWENQLDAVARTLGVSGKGVKVVEFHRAERVKHFGEPGGAAQKTASEFHPG